MGQIIASPRLLNSLALTTKPKYGTFIF